MASRLALSLLFAAGVSTSAQAGLISGNYALNNGNTVALQGLEWMPLTYTSGLSRNDIEDGFTDHFGNVWAAGEWQYATRAQTETLLGSLWDKKFDGWSNGNASGAWWFLENFGGLAYDSGFGVARVEKKLTNAPFFGYDHSNFFFGLDGECDLSIAISCQGSVQAMENYGDTLVSHNVITGTSEIAYEANSGAAGWFQEYDGLNAGFLNYNKTRTKSTALYERGSLLVRVATPATPLPVSAPTSLSVLAIGLISLLLRRRRPSHQ